MGDGKADDRRSTTRKLACDGSSDSAIYCSRPTYDAVSRAYFAGVRQALTIDNSPAGVVEDLEKQLKHILSE
jgi:hypothetical protein